MSVRVREASAADAPAVAALLAAWETELFGSAETSAGMLANASAIGDAAVVAQGGSRIVGHAMLRGHAVEVLVEPAERRRGVGTALLATVERAAVTERLRLTGVTLEPAAAPFALANGYAKAWEVWLMGVDLAPARTAPAWPEGVAVRTFRAEDAAAVKELLDAAYAADPTQTPLPLEDWRTFMLGDPAFDPAAWFLAVADGRLVGAVLNWDDGFVKDLVVHPDWRGRGLGQALVLETMAEFARRGLPRLRLKTDSANPTQAWRLYERLGFTAERTYEVFEKRLRRVFT